MLIPIDPAWLPSHETMIALEMGAKVVAWLVGGAFVLWAIVQFGVPTRAGDYVRLDRPTKPWDRKKED
jgi:hypothetical protein